MSNEQNPTTAEGTMKAAWQAILAGDYAERDRLCERARRLIDAEHHAATVQRMLTVDFFVNSRGTAYPTKMLARAAGEIH